MLPGLRPAAELAKAHPHGVRIKYLGGCRCLPCRAANADYAREANARAERGDGNPLVDPKRARAYLSWLKYRGVSWKQVGRVAGISQSVMHRLTSRNPKYRRRHIRRNTENLILSVRPKHASDGARIDAAPTWRKIQWLLDHGYSKAAISRAIGRNGLALQIGKTKCNAGTAREIDNLHQTIKKAKE